MLSSNFYIYHRKLKEKINKNKNNSLKLKNKSETNLCFSRPHH